MSKHRKVIFVILTVSVIMIFAALYLVFERHVWLSKSNIIGRVTNEFGDGQGQTTMILRRKAVQVNRPAGETIGDNIYIFDSLPENPTGFFEYTAKIPLSDLKPLKLLSGDVNGDGKAELSVMMYKTTPFDPVMAKRPFFYNYRDGALYPLWLGSKLSRPFESYELWDDGRGGSLKLLSAEYLVDGSMALALYEWDNFGFVRVARSKGYNALTLVQQENPGTIYAFDDDDNPMMFCYDGKETIKEVE